MELRCKAERNGNVSLTVWDGKQTPEKDLGSGKYVGRKLSQAARTLGVNETWLLQQIWRLKEKVVGTEVVETLPTVQVTHLTQAPVKIRGMNQKDVEAHEYVSFSEALRCSTYPVSEPLITWSGMDTLCAVDGDYHGFSHDKRPDPEYLRGRLAALAPVPLFIWITHGRGIRLIYEAREGYLASELASVGAARLLQLEPLATMELKSETRHPLYPNDKGKMCSPIETRVPDTDCSAIFGWCGEKNETDETKIQEWLDENGYMLGGRYEHDRCPVDPGTPSHGTPVVCYESGIFCYGCAGHGIRRGTKAPGWFPYTIFVGNPSTSIIACCVKNFTHWEHARFILKAYHALSESIRKGCYSALLKHHWGNDPRLSSVFNAGRDVLRYNKRWGTLQGEMFTATRSDAIVAKLPTCHYIDSEGKVKVDGERVARLLQPTSLERYGYPYLRPVWGLPIYSHTLIPKYPYEIVMYRGPGEPPQYIPKDQRISEETAWARMQEAFPGINRKAIKLLIAAKGCAEADGTFPPFIFLTGPTSSAKTTSVTIAAAICGDKVKSIPVIPDDQRIRASIMEAKDSGTFVVMNEAIKTGNRRDVSKTAAIEFALSLTHDCMNWKVYVGPVEMGSLPVMCWTDVHIPPEVKKHAQLARRIIEIHLDRSIEWRGSQKDTGMGRAEDLRVAGEEYVEAANTILSSVIDEFFSSPATFEEIANRLGFTTLAYSDEARDQYNELRTFYELVSVSRKDEQGFVYVDINRTDALSQVWRELSDPDGCSSQRCSEVDWAQVLGIPGPVRFVVNPKGTKVKMKFEGV